MGLFRVISIRDHFRFTIKCLTEGMVREVNGQFFKLVKESNLQNSWSNKIGLHFSANTLHHAETYITKESKVKVVPYPCFDEATSEHKDDFDSIQIL